MFKRTIWVWASCTFDAAHTLPLHEGKCTRLHGHTYKVELGLLVPIDEETGMGIDMGRISDFLRRQVQGKFDHYNLNDKMNRPTTAENIADEVLKDAIREFPNLLLRIRVFETPTHWVEAEAMPGTMFAKPVIEIPKAKIEITGRPN